RIGPVRAGWAMTVAASMAARQIDPSSPEGSAAGAEHAAARDGAGLSADAAFVGRGREQKELGAAHVAARGGHGRLVPLSGEPGIGKRALAHAIARDATARGAEVLWGRCWGDAGAPAYWPWIQVIRTHALACTPPELAGQLGRGAPLIAELVPELRDVLPNLG